MSSGVTSATTRPHPADSLPSACCSLACEDHCTCHRHDRRATDSNSCSLDASLEGCTTVATGVPGMSCTLVLMPIALQRAQEGGCRGSIGVACIGGSYRIGLPRDCLTDGLCCREGCSFQHSVGLLWMMLLRQVCECCSLACVASPELMGCMSMPMQRL